MASKILILTLNMILFGGILGAPMPQEMTVENEEGSILKKLTPEQKQQVDTIVADKSLNKAQFMDKLKALINGLPEELKKEANKELKKKEEFEQELEKKQQEAMPSLSPGAKAFLEKSQAIHKDMTISWQQEVDQVKQLYDALSADAKKEIDDKLGVGQKLNDIIS